MHDWRTSVVSVGWSTITLQPHVEISTFPPFLYTAYFLSLLCLFFQKHLSWRSPVRVNLGVYLHLLLESQDVPVVPGGLISKRDLPKCRPLLSFIGCKVRVSFWLCQLEQFIVPLRKNTPSASYDRCHTAWYQQRTCSFCEDQSHDEERRNINETLLQLFYSELNCLRPLRTRVSLFFATLSFCCQSFLYTGCQDIVCTWQAAFFFFVPWINSEVCTTSRNSSASKLPCEFLLLVPTEKKIMFETPGFNKTKNLHLVSVFCYHASFNLIKHINAAKCFVILKLA